MKKQLLVVVTSISLAAAWAASGPKLSLVTVHDVELSVFREGAQLFSNRPYRAPKLPSLLDGQTLVVAPIEGFQIDCLTDGRLYALAPETPYHKDTNVGEALVKQGFERVADVPVFQLFGIKAWERVVTFRKDVRAGEHFNVAKWAVFLGAGAVERSDAPLPPCLANPQTRIDIDCGRQLFVDDFLIEWTYGVARHWNRPVKQDDPVVWPGGGAAPKLTDGSSRGWRVDDPAVNLTCATDGGLWWDPTKRKFRLWYQADWTGDICYAESTDGIVWNYPDLGIVPGTNRLFEHDKIDSWNVTPNYAATNPYADWKLHVSEPHVSPGSDDRLWTSEDGIHFKALGRAGISGDRSTSYYDPFRGVWVFSLRDGWPMRARRYFASRTFGGPDCRWSWCDKEPEEFHGLPRAERWMVVTNGVRRQLYSFNAVAYESVMLGVMEILYNTPNDNKDCEEVGLPKKTALHFTFSRDGKTFEPRTDADIAPSGWGSGKWDTGYLSCVGGICVIKDERLWFYYSGLRGDRERIGKKYKWHRNGMYSNGAIGVATLRRDGFAGMVADGKSELLTKPVRFSGKRLFVNAECRFGSLAAEVLDANGKPVEGFTRKDCKALQMTDVTKAELVFAGGDLSALAGRDVRFRFLLHCGTLYSFWVSPSAKGESRGYVAAGGPAYPGLRDL